MKDLHEKSLNIHRHFLITLMILYWCYSTALSMDKLFYFQNSNQYLFLYYLMNITITKKWIVEPFDLLCYTIDILTDRFNK